MRYYIKLVLALSLLTSLAFAKTQHLDEIIAVVNQQVITKQELKREFKQSKASLSAKNISLPPDSVLKKQVLDHLIEVRLQLQLAKKAGLIVEKEILNRATRNLAQQNDLSVRELKQKLEKDGISYREFRKELYNQLLIDQIHQREIIRNIKISEQELTDAQKHLQQKNDAVEYKISNIRIELPEVPNTEDIKEAKQHAEAVYQKLINGAEFSKTAVAESSGESALSAGDMGWRSFEELPTKFSNYITKLKVGEITQPIQTSNGFYILKLVDKRTDETDPEQQTALLRDKIFKRKFEEALQNWLRRLRAQAYIKINDNALN